MKKRCSTLMKAFLQACIACSLVIPVFPSVIFLGEYPYPKKEDY